MAFNQFPTSSPWPPLDLANDLNDNFSKTVEVSLSTNPADGAVLVYDASADIWTDGQETVTLDNLTNVVLDTAPTDGDILTYDASSDTWINSPAVTYSLEELDNVTISTTPTDGSALVYDASSDTWVDGEAAGGDPTINSQTGTSYTLVIGDAYNTVSMDNASANTLTIPTNASVAFDTGTVIAVLQEGAGTTTISGDTGVTVNGTSGGSEDIGTQYASAALVKVGTDEWVVAVGSGSGGGGSTTLDGLTDVVLSTSPSDSSILVYDASSDTWVDTTAISGTTGTFSGDLAVNTDDLFVDVSTGNVGIGITTPDEELHISAPVPTIKLDETDAGGGYSRILMNSDILSFRADEGAAGSSAMGFSVGGSEAMRIDSSGNVGIGTTSPANPLHINANNPDITLEDSSQAGQALISSPSGHLIFVADELAETVDSFISFRVDGTNGTTDEAMRIDASLDVGIGTSSPSTRLDVNGAITQHPLSSDPADPDSGNSVMWVSDGTGSGDAGDVMLKINVGGTTKTITLVDYSAS